VRQRPCTGPHKVCRKAELDPRSSLLVSPTFDQPGISFIWSAPGDAFLLSYTPAFFASVMLRWRICEMSSILRVSN
jgi:hypothetical protein